MKIQRLLLCLWLAAGACEANTRGPSAAPKVVHVGLGSLVLGSNGNPGVGVTLAAKFFQGMPNLYLGLDTGLFIRTDPATAFLVPLLPMVYFRFPINLSLTPMLGVGVGGLLGLGNGARVLDFMLMVNPGFQFTLSTSIDLFFRSNLGFIGGTPTFYPQLGASFKLQ